VVETQIYEIQVEVKIEIEGGNKKILNLSLDLTFGPLRRRLTPLRVNFKQLPAVMGKRLVGFRHFVRILSLFDRGPAVIGRIGQFGRKFFLHRLF